MNKKDFEYTNEELAELSINNPDFKSPAFQLYVNDILGSNKILMMEPEALAGYMMLLFVSWNEIDCGIPTEDRLLVKLSRLLPDIFDKVKKQILENFFEYKGRYYNRRLLLERKKQINMRTQRISAVRKRYEKPTSKLRNESEIESESETEYETENTIEGRFYKIIPEKLMKLEGFWEAWKDWVDYREGIQTLLPIQAKKQLEFLEKHEDPVNHLIQALANSWSGLIYENKNNGKSNSKSDIPEYGNQEELLTFHKSNNIPDSFDFWWQKFYTYNSGTKIYTKKQFIKN